jgi:threonine/homoserine/homoserine lactone efflux protein
MTEQENTEQKERGHDFYLGVIIGIMGNLFVSSFIEWSASIWEHKPIWLLIQWSVMLLVSQTALFQSTKKIMKYYVSTKRFSRTLDAVTIFLFFIVIVSIILANVSVKI